MAESLFLNKIKVDIYNKPITRKIQIGEVSEVDQRKSSFSYTIKIPRTARNEEVFEMLGSIGNTSRKPYENIVADYVVDGIYLVLNGSAIIRQTSSDYELNIIDGIKSLSDLLAGKNISDLPLTDLDHILTSQNLVDSFSNTEGFIYCLGDFGQGVSASLKAEKQAPSIFVHTLFRRIFESNGLNLIGEFFTTNENYLSEVLTPSRGYEITDSSLTTDAKGGADTNILEGYQTANDFIQIDRKYDFTGISLVGASVVGGNIVFSVAGTYTINIETSYNIFETYITQVLKINDVAKSYQYIEQGNSTATKEITFTVEAGDELSLHIQGGSDLISDDGFFSVNYSISADTLLYLQTGGFLVQVSDYIGDISQLDFIKDVINRYGLVLRPVRNAEDFEFKRLEALLNDSSTAEDWTKKLSGIESENYISGYSKVNKAVYQYPEEIVVPNNDGEMLIDNENASNEKTMFSSTFEIPVTSSSVGGNKTYLVPIWEIKDSVVNNAETPLKVMRIKRIDTSVTVKLFTEVTGVTETENIPFLSLENMSMQYFISNYYKAFQNMISNYKRVTLNLLLSVIDIFNLDFFKLKYLRQTGRFYYLNSVQHTNGQISKVEAIEIKEFPVNLPPSQVGNFSFNMNHGTTRTITLSNLKTNYEDPELDEPLKIKIISGFNTNILLKQNGVIITAETEINVADLALTAVETVNGTTAYSESWVFAIADEGSGTFGTQTGTITANVLSYANNPPVANAGSDQTIQVIEPGENLNLESANLNGSASYDDTGEIVSWSWAIITKPTNSTASIIQDTSTPLATMAFSNHADNIGIYTLRLTVTDEFGATDTDDKNITVEYI